MTILYLDKTRRMKAEKSIISKAWWSEESVEMAQKQKNVSRGEDYIYQDCWAAMQTETGSEKDNSQKAGLAERERKARAIWIIKE